METSGKEEPKYQVKGEKPQTAAGEAAATPQGDKPKPRRNRNKKPQADKEKADGEATRGGEAGADAGEAKQERQPRQKRDKKPKEDTQGERPETAGGKGGNKYRVKGEKPDGEQAEAAEEANASKDQKDAPDGEAPKKRRRNNTKSKGPKEDKANGQAEPKYRVKGEKAENEDQTKDGEEKKKREQPERQKNLVYRNPMDFKEKKKFKSKWEEYHYGEWKRGSGKTFVTLETVIPAPPEKPIAAPDEAAYRKKKQDIDDSINGINTNLGDRKTQFEEVLAQKQAARGSKQQAAADAEAKDTAPKARSLKEMFSRMGELNKQKKAIYVVQDQIAETQATLTREKEQLSKSIDKRVQKAKDIPKAIKECQKELETTSGGLAKERDLIQRMKILKESIPHIEKRDVIDEKIDEQFRKKKESGRGLPKILQECKAIQAEIDSTKKGQEEKSDALNAFDTQLNRISDKRKQDWDAKDKLRKQKDELNDEYYGSLILYSKYQYLLSDIKWMTDMQNMLKDKAAAKQKYEDEKKARKEKYEREKEERRLREEERKKKEEERKVKIAANKKAMEASLRQTEIDGLAKIQDSIDDNNLGSNPMFGVIEQIEFLQKLCKRRLASPEEEASKVTQAPEESKGNQKNDLDTKLKKGAIMAAPTKEQRLAEITIGHKGKKNNRKQKKNQQDDKAEGSLDFSTVKKFGALKLAPPLTNEEYEKTLKELDVLKAAVIYWGKIQQRIRKVKFIRDSRKIFSEDEFKTQSEDEEKFIDAEKSKYSGESTEGHEVDAEKLKVAQIIYRENTMKQAWNAEDDGEDYQSSDEDRGFGADEAGDEENPLVEERREGADGQERKVKKAQRGAGAKATQRPNKESFKKIMGQAEAFPTLENDFEDEEASEGEGEAEEEEEAPVAETPEQTEGQTEQEGATAAENTETQ